ncbi:hypothetical protein FQR65_LT09330 [Abscondita terminalis]|nr:hypothetical protein FQR65_LT09330 [Abscondita terminalis]
MITKLSAVLLCAFLNFQKIESRCWRILTIQEIECSMLLDLNTNLIPETYASDTHDPKFGKFLDCVWLKWNYVDSDGVILYENLIQSNDLNWRATKVCHNNYSYGDSERISFQKAVKYCEKNPPSVENPTTVRKCINQKVESRCGYHLTDIESECAESLHLDSNSILELYRSDSNDLQFQEYLKCVFLKWNYVDEKGAIQYENLKKSNSLAWQMSRICHDIYQYLLQMRFDFKRAVDYCEKNRPVIENPSTIRRCIAENYKPSPVNLEITEFN